MTSNDYDALTLEIERADALCEHLAERVEQLDGRESFALSLIANDVRARLVSIGEKAKTLFSEGPR